jgi:cell division protein FtsZ
MTAEPTQMASSGELLMEVERPSERRSMAPDDGLEIPAFLRRQSS